MDERKIEVGEIAFRDSPTREMFLIWGIDGATWPGDEGGTFYGNCRLAELSDVKTADEAALFVGRLVQFVFAGQAQDPFCLSAPPLNATREKATKIDDAMF